MSHSVAYPRWNASVWETGEFTMGYINPKLVKKQEPTSNSALYADSTSALLEMCIDAHGLAETLEYVREHPEDYPRLPASPFDLSMGSNSHKTPVRRGQNGISSHGKRLVRNAALRMERECGVKSLSFLTLTIPGLDQEQSLAVTEAWAEIVRVFVQRLKRKLQALGLPGEIVGVTEVQEKRFQATGVLPLHLHLLFQGRKPGKHWVLAPGDVRGIWRSVVQRSIPGNIDNLYWDAVENLVPVRSSAVGYLGKYMSKGVDSVNKVKEIHPDVKLPTCWYICSNSIRRRVSQHILKLSSSRSPEFEDMVRCSEYAEEFLWLRPIYIEISDSHSIHIGYVGRIKPSLHRSLFSSYHHSKNRS